jgi:hypothetical protein
MGDGNPVLVNWPSNPHPNDMSLWDDIGCQRGHDTHSSHELPITIGSHVPHGYHDYPQIPKRFLRRFLMDVFDWSHYHYMGKPLYCPGNDAVSETIETIHIWEPAESILTLTVLSSQQPGIFLDLGAQIGWFSLLALSCGRHVYAVDADPEPLRLLNSSADKNVWSDWLTTQQRRIGDTLMVFPDEHIRLVKIDVEGAEDKAIANLLPHFEAGNIDHLLIEVSPVFASYYGDLVDTIIGCGYAAYRVPTKSTPPAKLDDIPIDMEPWRVDNTQAHQMANDCVQENWWFKKHGAEW